MPARRSRHTATASLAVDRRLKCSPPASSNARQYDQRHRQRRIVQRKNPQRPPHVEVAKVVLLAFRVEQNAGDQKTRQHEKQIDAPAAQLDQPRCPIALRRPIAAAAKAIQRHHHDRQPADRIQRRNMPARQLRRRCRRSARRRSKSRNENGRKTMTIISEQRIMRAKSARESTSVLTAMQICMNRL